MEFSPWFGSVYPKVHVMLLDHGCDQTNRGTHAFQSVSVNEWTFSSVCCVYKFCV